jgi:hypothetical protein
MSLSALLQEPDLTEPQNRLRRQFLDATGYGSSDILSLNYSTRTFLTRNGGCYKVEEDGTVTHLAGPAVDVDDRFEL